MKKNILNLMFLAVAAIFFVSCSEDDSVTVPKVSLSADVLTIAENATSPLVVKVMTDAPLGTAYDVKVNITGTAVAGVNYQEIASTVTIPANATSANIFVTPVNVSAIEDNTTVSIALAAGDVYDLAMEASVDLTITDNATPASDAPEVSFATSNIVTNPYLEEVKTITVGLTKTFASDLTVPLTIAGDLVVGTDYEIAGLTNGAIIIPAGAVSADITVTMKNTAVVGMNETITFGFATPSVTDYVVKAESTFAINAVDPQVDFSAWFNELNEYNFFYASYNTDEYVYRTDLPAYRVKRYYWDNTEPEGEEWNLLTGQHVVNATAQDANQWGEVYSTVHKELGGKYIYTDGFERYELQSGDFLGMKKFFGTKIASYGQTMMTSDAGWFRFVTTDASATEGTVVIPEQTLTVYKIKEGYEWTATTSVEIDVNGTLRTKKYFAWYADSRATQGDLSQSTNVTPVAIQVAKSVGTYNLATGMIDVDVTFTCDDADFVFDTKYGTKDGDTYTMKIQYRFFKAQP